MRALKFITGHMVYNLAYTWILQTTATIALLFCKPYAWINLKLRLEKKYVLKLHKSKFTKHSSE